VSLRRVLIPYLSVEVLRLRSLIVHIHRKWILVMVFYVDVVEGTHFTVLMGLFCTLMRMLHETFWQDITTLR